MSPGNRDNDLKNGNSPDLNDEINHQIDLDSDLSDLLDEGIDDLSNSVDDDDAGQSESLDLEMDLAGPEKSNDDFDELVIEENSDNPEDILMDGDIKSDGSESLEIDTEDFLESRTEQEASGSQPDGLEQTEESDHIAETNIDFNDILKEAEEVSLPDDFELDESSESIDLDKDLMSLDDELDSPLQESPESEDGEILDSGDFMNQEKIDLDSGKPTKDEADTELQLPDNAEFGLDEQSSELKPEPNIEDIELNGDENIGFFESDEQEVNNSDRDSANIDEEPQDSAAGDEDLQEYGVWVRFGPEDYEEKSADPSHSEEDAVLEEELPVNLEDASGQPQTNGSAADFQEFDSGEASLDEVALDQEAETDLAVKDDGEQNFIEVSEEIVSEIDENEQILNETAETDDLDAGDPEGVSEETVDLMSEEELGAETGPEKDDTGIVTESSEISITEDDEPGEQDAPQDLDPGEAIVDEVSLDEAEIAISDDDELASDNIDLDQDVLNEVLPEKEVAELDLDTEDDSEQTLVEVDEEEAGDEIEQVVEEAEQVLAEVTKEADLSAEEQQDFSGEPDHLLSKEYLEAEKDEPEIDLEIELEEEATAEPEVLENQTQEQEIAEDAVPEFESDIKDDKQILDETIPNDTNSEATDIEEDIIEEDIDLAAEDDSEQALAEAAEEISPIGDERQIDPEESGDLLFEEEVVEEVEPIIDDLGNLEQQLMETEPVAEAAGLESGALLQKMESEIKTIRDELTQLKQELADYQQGGGDKKAPSFEDNYSEEELKEAERKAEEIKKGFFEETDEDESFSLTEDELEELIAKAHEADRQAAETSAAQESGAESTEEEALSDTQAGAPVEEKLEEAENDSQIQTLAEEESEPVIKEEEIPAALTDSVDSVENQDTVDLEMIPETADDDELIVGEQPEAAPEEVMFVREEAGPVTAPETAEGDERIKEVKSVLTYMDKLLDSLPQDKIEEFANSEHYDTYRKLFLDLGLSSE